MPNHRLVPVAREAGSLLDVGAEAVPPHERMFAYGADGKRGPTPPGGRAPVRLRAQPAARASSVASPLSVWLVAALI
jgi:hypothetical protein